MPRQLVSTCLAPTLVPVLVPMLALVPVLVLALGLAACDAAAPGPCPERQYVEVGPVRYCVYSDAAGGCPGELRHATVLANGLVCASAPAADPFPREVCSLLPDGRCDPLDDAGMDAALPPSDAGRADGGGMDSGAGPGADSGSDSAVDSGVGSDVGPGIDAGIDAATDGEAADATSPGDAGTDAAGVDAGSPLDAGSDAGPDARTDGGCVAMAVDEIAAGSVHTCAIAGGRLYCWGSNSTGALGLGGGMVGARFVRPTRVGARTAWSRVSVAGDHSCAVDAAGTLWCWGSNGDGALGFETSGVYAEPTQVGTGSSWSNVAVGSSHSCAITRTGGLYCFGRGDSGQLGRGSTSDGSLGPAVAPPASGRWEGVGVGAAHTCATLSGGMYCWGSGVFGQLGTMVDVSIDGGSPYYEATARAVENAPGVPSWAGVDTGDDMSCGADPMGNVFCWGYNASGDLGAGDMETMHTIPTHVMGGLPMTGAPVSSLSAGARYACVVTATHQLYCWGMSSSGQLGTGAYDSRPMATLVTAPPGDSWERVSAGSDHACATRDGGTLFCWGRDDAGQLGLEASLHVAIPTPSPVCFPP